ncbi:MAG: leucyl aminopeptidase family protein [Legionellales bacterium]|nr:leucyl aminopeptidase family protein [Legionellales bacterium]
MLPYFSQENSAILLTVVTETEFATWLTQQDPILQNKLQAQGFTGKEKQIFYHHDDRGCLNTVIVGCKDIQAFWGLAFLPELLTQGVYEIRDERLNPQNLALTWGLACYQFTRYKKNEKTFPQLKLSEKINYALLENMLVSHYLIRDLINTPPQDMLPTQLCQVARDLAQQYQAEFTCVQGAELAQHFPAVYTVGKAADDKPCLADLHWGNPQHPLVTLVGKGVCFDSGGLDIKSSSGMALMKKDMGGAAHVLGLAQLIMAQQLPIRLRVLIPIVENAISGNAMRPSDIITTRSGKTVEVTNTDAEGRLILCDALTAALDEKPELIIDIATLTGAAKVAVGTEIAAMFANQDSTASALEIISQECADPLWRLPLHQPYLDMMQSSIADLKNSSDSGYAGAITAALFLQEFVDKNTDWVHFDLMAWNTAAKPGRPQGGEAQLLRVLFAYLAQRFGA